MRELLRRLDTLLEADARTRATQMNFDALEDNGWRVAEEPFRSGPSSPNLRKRRVATSPDGRIKVTIGLTSKVNSSAIAIVDGVIKTWAYGTSPSASLSAAIEHAKRLVPMLDDLKAAFPGQEIQGFEDLTIAGFRAPGVTFGLLSGPVTRRYDPAEDFRRSVTVSYVIRRGNLQTFGEEETFGEDLEAMVNALGDVKISRPRKKRADAEVPMSIVDDLVKMGWKASREDVIFGDRGARRLDWPCATSQDGRIKIWPSYGSAQLSVVSLDGMISTLRTGRPPVFTAMRMLETIDRVRTALPGYRVRKTKNHLYMQKKIKMASVGDMTRTATFFPNFERGGLLLVGDLVGGPWTRLELGDQSLEGLEAALERPVMTSQDRHNMFKADDYISGVAY